MPTSRPRPVAGTRSSFAFRALALATLAGAAAPASATWSILIADTRTGEIAVGSATCLTNIDLRENTPVLITGRGALTAQSAVDTEGFNRGLARDLILDGLTPDDILLELENFDPNHQTRQYGFVDARGLAATFSGLQASEWKGGVTGRIERGRPGPEDDIVYAVQGNILTGAPVVLMAEQAIIHALPASTDQGDLALALMLSMEAAYDFGGDGRCSCDQGATACGSPPVGFDPLTDKTADVGYMLVGRPGDVEGGTIRIPTIDRSRAIDASDLDNDGRLDLVVGLQNAGDILLFRNTTEPAPRGRGFTELDPAGTIRAGYRINALFLADTNDDGLQDIISVGRTATATVFPGLGDFAFGPGLNFPIVNDAFDAVLADAFPGNPGPELIVIGRNTRTAQVYTLNPTPAPLGSPITLPGAGQNAKKVPGPLGEGFVAASESTNELVWYASDGFSLTLAATIPTVPAPRGVASADFNNDGLPDFAAASFNAGQVAIHLQIPGSNPPAFTTTIIPTGLPGYDIVATDLDGDGDQDLAVAVGEEARDARDMLALYNDGAGAFPDIQRRAATRDARRYFPIDTTGDGLPDIVGGGINVLSVGDNRGTGPNPEPGFAGGDYHLAFNVAFVNAADPDPVLTLRDQYDAWRAANAGVPDAIRSTLQLPPILTAGASFTIELTARDLDNNPATIDPSVVDLIIDGPDANPIPGLVSLTAVTPTPTGVTLQLTAGNTFGQHPARIRIARAGERDIELLPSPTIRVGLNAADYNLDGVNTFNDIALFLNLFIANDPAADITADGQLTFADITAFLTAFQP